MLMVMLVVVMLTRRGMPGLIVFNETEASSTAAGMALICTPWLDTTRFEYHTETLLNPCAMVVCRPAGLVTAVSVLPVESKIFVNIS